MDMPYDVRQLFTLFYPHSDEGYDSDKAWIAGTVKSFSRDRKVVILSYLNDLLMGTDNEIARAWRSVSPSYDFLAGGHRKFLTLVRDEINRQWREAAPM